MEEKIGIIDTNEILDFWKEFNFELKRESLDKVCVEIKNQKATSINGRKKLNDLTKVFRSKSLEEQTAEVHDLLKSYQAEIDQLSRRSKFCESSFFNLYKSIYEAPDPVPAIEALIQALSSTSSYQIEIEKLKNEISQYEKEFQNLKNQDITIRRLEDQLSDYKLRIEDKVVEEVNKRTSEMEDHSESRIATIYEVQKAAEKRLASAIESMKQAQISAERAQTQLYDVTSQADMRCSALSVENSLLAEGADRLNARIAELENEVEVLRKTKQSANTASLTTPKKSLFLSSNEGNSSNLTSIMSLADEDADTLRLVITELREDMRRKEDAARAEKSHSEHILRDMTQQLTREKDQVTRLKMDLAERPLKEDYITVKRQLKLLQKVTFHLEDDDDDSNDVRIFTCM